MLNLFQLEDCIKLNLPVDSNKIDLENLNWVQYNPRKNIKRFGCSITSLDGEASGIPDLDSLLEFNIIHNTNYKEKDFNLRTKFAEPFAEFLTAFTVGRSHYLKLNSGGFFPWHRDLDDSTFRIIYTIKNCGPENLIWVEDEQILNFNNNEWYYVNTKKKHALFAFEECVFAVFNVLLNSDNVKLLQKNFKIK